MFSLMILLSCYPSFKLCKVLPLKLLKTSYLTLLFSCIFWFSFSPVMRFLFNDDVHDLYSYLLVTAKVNSIPFCMNYSSYATYIYIYCIWYFLHYLMFHLIYHIYYTFFPSTCFLRSGGYFCTHFGSLEDTV